MKILCIIEATTVTGPAKNLLNFCRLVRSSDFAANRDTPVEISIVTFARNDGRNDFARNGFIAAARDAGITVDVIREGSRFDPRVFRQLRAIVARRAPDVIQTHMIKSHFLMKLSGLGKKYPWVAYHHGYTTTDLKMRVYNQLNRWSLPSAARVITVCEAFAKQLTATGVRSDRIRIRHNSVRPPRRMSADERRGLRTELGIREEEIVILSIGRLSREKGHRDLIQAASLLCRSSAELKFKLLLVGDGPEREQLKTTAKDLALADEIVFVGHVSDVAPYYSIADALALPSHSEGSPNVLLEAMAAGLPVVATTVGGVPEIATSEENALLVPSHDPSALAQALHRVLTQPELARTLKTNAIARARDFSPESQARALIEIYQELVSVPRPIASGSYNQPRLHDPVAIAPGTDTV